MPVSLPTTIDCRGGGISHRVVCCCGAAQADPNALWNIVHGQCVPDELEHGDPKPCAEVELGSGLAAGYAVLKDIRGTTQYLLIPTRQIGGIESRALLERHARQLLRRCVAGAAPGREDCSGTRCRATCSAWPLIRNWRGRRTSCIFISTASVPMCARRCAANVRQSAGTGSRCRSCLPVIATAPCVLRDGRLPDTILSSYWRGASQAPPRIWATTRLWLSACSTPIAVPASSSSTITPIPVTAMTPAARSCKTILARWLVGKAKRADAAGARSIRGSRWRPRRRRTAPRRW